MSNITQRGATGPLALQVGGSFPTSTDAALVNLVGTRFDTSDGREVILVSVGSASAATSGHLMQDAALIAAHQNATTGTFVAYSNNGNIPAKLTLTIGATAMTANQYQGGLAVVNAGTGKGQVLRIASNTAAVSSGTQGTVTLEDAPNTALDTTSKISLVPAHGANVVDFPTTPTSSPVGAAIYNIAASSYGFLVCKGITGVLSDPTIAGVGYAISPSTASAGNITVASTGGGTTPTLTNAIIGSALIAGVSGEARPVNLTL